MSESISLYVHIPFCKQKCKYCDFLSWASTAETRSSYVDALVKEIKEKAALYGHPSVKTVFFGGGTPTALHVSQLERICQVIREEFSLLPEAEWSMECNPGLVDTEGFRRFLDAGINRLSIGLQSTDDGELATLGRIHDYETFLTCYEDARKAGFQNINVDLMMAIPGQHLKSFQESLRKVILLCPEHISVYSLMIEEGTPFYALYEEDVRKREKTGEASGQLCSEDEERQMYHVAEAMLQEAGYQRYEISNYAKPGRECKHNMVYWKRGYYLGVGLGAASMMWPAKEEDRQDWKEVRFHRTLDLKEYLEGDYTARELEYLLEEERMAEFAFLGLRCKEGISPKTFELCFQKEIHQVYGRQITKLMEEDLLEESEGRIKLTEKGTDLANIVFAEFL